MISTGRSWKDCRKRKGIQYVCICFGRTRCGLKYHHWYYCYHNFGTVNRSSNTLRFCSNADYFLSAKAYRGQDSDDDRACHSQSNLSLCPWQYGQTGLTRCTSYTMTRFYAKLNLPFKHCNLNARTWYKTYTSLCEKCVLTFLNFYMVINTKPRRDVMEQAWMEYWISTCSIFLLQLN